MPELPEVEIQVQTLQRLRRQTIRAARSHDPKLRLPRSLAGKRIERIWRRGKYIVFDLCSGRGKASARTHLLAHLRMTGWFQFRPPDRFCRAEIRTTRETIYFEDQRRFGVLESLTPKELADRLGRLGPEPFDPGFSLDRVRASRRAIKLVLLDQERVAGLGNIYASESLWRARIHPRRAANRLGDDAARLLVRGIRRSLRKAIAYGPKIFEVQGFAVYDREGETCGRCGRPVRRIVQGQRSTFFCPACQS